MNNIQEPEHILLNPTSKTILDIPIGKDGYCGEGLAEQLTAVMPQLKSALIGKPLNKILNKNIWFTCLPDENLPMTYENVHLVYFEDFSFLIGQELLHITLYEPDKYQIKLNTVKEITIYETKDLPVKNLPKLDYFQTKNFIDISHIYGFLLGAKVMDITLKIEEVNDPESPLNILRTFIIHLSNGFKITIYNQDDNPCIRIL